MEELSEQIWYDTDYHNDIFFLNYLNRMKALEVEKEEERLKFLKLRMDKIEKIKSRMNEI